MWREHRSEREMQQGMPQSVFFGPGSPVVGSLEVRQQPLLVIDADRVGDGRGRVGMVAPAARDLNVVNDRRSRGTAVVFPAVLD